MGGRGEEGPLSVGAGTLQVSAPPSELLGCGERPREDEAAQTLQGQLWPQVPQQQNPKPWSPAICKAND